MAKEHKISWLNMPGYKPETWNPIVGCNKVSSGCERCYAERIANRLSVALGAKGTEPSDSWIAYSEVIKNGHWNGKTATVKSALIKPASWKSPRMVFVCSMGDLFHETVPFEWIDAVFSVMSDNDQHIYVILTKRPENMLMFWKWKQNQHGIDWQPKDNVWIGVSAENQEQANKRIPYLNCISAAVKLVSIEPMLSKIDFSEALGNTLKWHAGGLKNCISWVICGGESGPKARPMHPDWVRRLRDDCLYAGVPFFFKQWGTLAPFSTVDGRQILPFDYMKYNPETKEGYIRGIKDDRLDGKQHHEWPKIN